MPLRPGETFGRYQLAELLGRGGMGAVYSAYDTLLHRKVALKVLTGAPSPADHGTPASGGAARILREARAAAGIAHPGAISIYDVGEIDGVPFLAMELVAGKTLRAFVGDESVPLSRRVGWLIDVARALGAAHQLGIVHRDMKPENVMVGDDGFVKVLDFGIARRSFGREHPVAIDPADLIAISELGRTNGTLTAEGALVGTPMYMAPEQLLGGRLDGRTDQFGWGVVAYELLTGRLPWNGHGAELIAEILVRAVAPLTERSALVPAPVDAVVRRALRKAGDERFASMEALADELEPFAGTTGRNKRVASAATEALVPSSAGASFAGRRGVVVGAIAIGAIAALGLGARAVRSHRAEVPAVDAAAVEVSSRVSTNPEAATAYRAGMQALRDGSLAPALKQLDRAGEIDPVFGAAHLRLALANLLRNDVSAVDGATLQAAHTAQDSLGTHDRTLFDAFEACSRSPPDYKEAERILSAATDAHPLDGDFPFHLALVFDYDSQPARAAQVIETATQRDPTFAFGWRMKGTYHVEMGDVAGGREAFERCVGIAPNATTCLYDLGNIAAADGKCDELAEVGRKLTELVPDNAAMYTQLAQGLAGSGASTDAIRAVLDRSHALRPEAKRSSARAFDEAYLAILGGDLEGAMRRYDECDRLDPLTITDEASFGAAYARVLLAVEMGRSADVTKFAEGYLRLRPGLVSGNDHTLEMRAAELAVGAITPQRFAEARAQWLTGNSDLEPPLRWVNAYALTARTRAEAEAAIALKPAVEPLFNIFALTPVRAASVGRMYLLAGRLNEAIDYLRAGSRFCGDLDGETLIFATWAALDLGSALEARGHEGDKAAACAAYDRVLARWGKAAPRSQTAQRALARTKALGCSR